MLRLQPVAGLVAVPGSHIPRELRDTSMGRQEGWGPGSGMVSLAGLSPQQHPQGFAGLFWLPRDADSRAAG